MPDLRAERVVYVFDWIIAIASGLTVLILVVGAYRDWRRLLGSVALVVFLTAVEGISRLRERRTIRARAVQLQIQGVPMPTALEASRPEK